MRYTFSFEILVSLHFACFFFSVLWQDSDGIFILLYRCHKGYSPLQFSLLQIAVVWERRRDLPFVPNSAVSLNTRSHTQPNRVTFPQLDLPCPQGHKAHSCLGTTHLHSWYLGFHFIPPFTLFMWCSGRAVGGLVDTDTEKRMNSKFYSPILITSEPAALRLRASSTSRKYTGRGRMAREEPRGAKLWCPIFFLPFIPPSDRDMDFTGSSILRISHFEDTLLPGQSVLQLHTLMFFLMDQVRCGCRTLLGLT